MNNFDWLAADYHFPSSYSIRVPHSSVASTEAMPAPGPATVRLALIRNGIELFGTEAVKNEIFSTIKSAEIRISPPERIAISSQTFRIYKPIEDKSGATRYQESIAIRQVAHAQGNMTIYVKVPSPFANVFRQLLPAIGYWGQTNSLSVCVKVSYREPDPSILGLPIENATSFLPNQYSCFVTEFNDSNIEWQDVTTLLKVKRKEAFKFMIYVWPMRICEQNQENKLLLRCPQSSYTSDC